MTDVTMSRVIKVLLVHEGFPKHIVMENSVQFTSHEFKDYFAELGIVHTTPALYQNK